MSGRMHAWEEVWLDNVADWQLDVDREPGVFAGMVAMDALDHTIEMFGDAKGFIEWYGQNNEGAGQ